MNSQDYKKQIRSDMKLADSIFKNGYSKQAKNPNKLINVGYGFKVTKNLLEDVKLIIDFNVSLITYDLRYGLVTRQYADKECSILLQLKQSVDKTISELFTKGDKR